jgi:hydrogenase maturation protein HypF
VARGLAGAIASSCREHGLNVAVVSGGVFQNQLLMMELLAGMPASIALWTNRTVPPNDGGISLGQAALAALC